MFPRENKNNAYAKRGGTTKEYYCISALVNCLALIKGTLNRLIELCTGPSEGRRI